jgi:hypothetical protein
MTSIRVKDLFAEEITNGIKMFMGGRDTYDYEKLTDEEVDAVHLAFDKNLKRIENVSPKLAANLRPQREAFVKWAGIAKAVFPETKSYAYPAVAGGLGADWITPEMFKYDTTPSGTYPCYSDYNATASADDTFDLTLTAGTMRMIAGYQTGGTLTSSYKGSKTTDKHSFVVLAQDGLVEVGTTPKINMLKFATDLENKYAYVSMNPLLTQTIEDNRTLYQYNTPGMIPMDHNVGTYIGVMPVTSGTCTIVPLGMVFYEYSFLDTLPRTTATP